jgi:hypothetical protein
MRIKDKRSILAVCFFLCVSAILLLSGTAEERPVTRDACTDIIVGKDASVDGSVITSHTGYPQMNEHQLAIGESTLSQRDELKVDISSGKQIMTIEQAQLFAL